MIPFSVLAVTVRHDGRDCSVPAKEWYLVTAIPWGTFLKNPFVIVTDGRSLTVDNFTGVCDFTAKYIEHALLAHADPEDGDLPSKVLYTLS